MKKAMFLVLLSFGLMHFAAFAADGTTDFESVKPLLAAKCGICHASDMKHPFSSKIPVWNHMTGTHTGLAHKKYDMDAFFESGGEIESSQLMMLEHVVRKKSMPPVQYKLFHRKMRLTSEERESILNWIYSEHPDWKPAG